MAEIIGVIPARGGSTRVPLKNLKQLGGIPLIAHTIRAAIASRCLDRIIVSTDHDGIAAAAEYYGAEVPFRRPAEISEDVETELVMKHTISFLEERGVDVAAVVVLQPTSPFRRPETIRQCVDIFLADEACDSVVTVTQVEGERPEWMLAIGPEGNVIPYATPFEFEGIPIIKLTARQSFPRLYRQNGAMYIAKRSLLMEKGLLIGPAAKAVIIDEFEAHDLDTEFDFLVAEAAISHKVGFAD